MSHMDPAVITLKFVSFLLKHLFSALVIIIRYCVRLGRIVSVMCRSLNSLLICVTFVYG